jgi:integrase
MRRTGADTRTRMEALGHSSPAMTIGTYEFSDREMAEQAMERLADIVRGAP